MRTITTVLAATAVVLSVAGPALAGCGAARTVQVGALSGDPEKDTFGLTCESADIEQTSSTGSTGRGGILQVGASTGDDEKDTLGYVQAVSVQ